MGRRSPETAGRNNARRSALVGAEAASLAATGTCLLVVPGLTAKSAGSPMHAGGASSPRPSDPSNDRITPARAMAKRKRRRERRSVAIWPRLSVRHSKTAPSLPRPPPLLSKSVSEALDSLSFPRWREGRREPARPSEKLWRLGYLVRYARLVVQGPIATNWPIRTVRSLVAGRTGNRAAEPRIPDPRSGRLQTVPPRRYR